MTSEQSEASAPMDEDAAADKGWLMPMVMQLVMAVVVCAAMIAAYHYYVVLPNKQRLASVDIAEILDIKQLQLTQAALAKDIDDAGRGRLYDDLGTFSTTMEKAVADLQTECGCTLLVRAAVVKSDQPDLTDALKARLGMAGLDPAVLAKQVARSGGSGGESDKK